MKSNTTENFRKSVRDTKECKKHFLSIFANFDKKANFFQLSEDLDK